MEIQKVKKVWTKPEIHLLSRADDVNGGGANSSKEVHDGNQNKVIYNGNPYITTIAVYNNAHS